MASLIKFHLHMSARITRSVLLAKSLEDAISIIQKNPWHFFQIRLESYEANGFTPEQGLFAADYSDSNRFLLDDDFDFHRLNR